ncbi:MAG: FtsX-like permease family protein [Muribaculaceae bacterium]|nr:FtsX-like permease family protein [Muribaculaceae bacterium]
MLALDIARRYLLSRKSHAAVNVICAVAVGGVAVAVMAIVVVLSVFNGFSSLAASQMGRFDAALRIEPAAGAVLPADADSLAGVLEAMPRMEAAVAVLDERALAVSAGAQLPVRIKGVGEGFGRVIDMDSIVVDGCYTLDTVAGMAPANLSAGVAVGLGVRPQLGSEVAVYVPRRLGRINPANPAAAFRADSLAVLSVWQTERPEYDADRIVMPIATARNLLQRGAGEASAIEAAVAPGVSAGAVAAELARTLGPQYRVLTRERQNEQSFRMIAIEKWLTFAMLVCILAVAAFNIVSTLSLLVIEKRDNMATLRALGATRGTARAVFMWQGVLIALAGGVAGMAVGLALCLAQQHFGLVHLSADASALTVSVYPVEVHAADMLAVAGVVAVAAAISAAVAAIFTKDIE